MRNARLLLPFVGDGERSSGVVDSAPAGWPQDRPVPLTLRIPGPRATWSRFFARDPPARGVCGDGALRSLRFGLTGYHDRCALHRSPSAARACVPKSPGAPYQSRNVSTSTPSARTRRAPRFVFNAPTTTPGTTRAGDRRSVAGSPREAERSISSWAHGESLECSAPRPSRIIPRPRDSTSPSSHGQEDVVARTTRATRTGYLKLMEPGLSTERVISRGLNKSRLTRSRSTISSTRPGIRTVLRRSDIHVRPLGIPSRSSRPATS